MYSASLWDDGSARLEVGVSGRLSCWHEPHSLMSLVRAEKACAPRAAAVRRVSLSVFQSPFSSPGGIQSLFLPVWWSFIFIGSAVPSLIYMNQGCLHLESEESCLLLTPKKKISATISLKIATLLFLPLSLASHFSFVLQVFCYSGVWWWDSKGPERLRRAILPCPLVASRQIVGATFLLHFPPGFCSCCFYYSWGGKWS